MSKLKTRHRHSPLRTDTRRMIAAIFDRLDYARLGPIYCDEGGTAFWKAKRKPCRELGLKLAAVLRNRLKPKGHSLYVGAGVAELPLVVMETMELGRHVTACNLRAGEVSILNRACQDPRVEFICTDAGRAMQRGRARSVDHLWIVSTLNDPERFPTLSALSYGRADPVTFDPAAFVRERREVLHLVESCLSRLTRPGLVTTSVEEVPWITDWCMKRGVSYAIEKKEYPTALVGDPICLIRIGRPRAIR
jgi:hypothetical protein